MSSEKSIDQIETYLERSEAQPTLEPMEAEHADAENSPSADQEEPAEAAAATLSDGSEVGHEVDPDTKRKLNRLDHLRRQKLNLIEAEIARHEKTVAKIAAAHETIAKAETDLRNARTELAIHHEQKDAALVHRREHEDKLRQINDTIRELSLSPAERRARDTRNEWLRRRAEAEAEAAAAKEAFENELVPHEQHYVRLPKTRRSEPDKWAIVAAHNRHIQVKRKDLPQYEAEHEAAVAHFAKAVRDEMADEYVSELRTNGRPTYFASKIERGIYLSQWGSDSLRGRAYRARQLERGLPEDDPVKLGKPLPGIHVDAGQS
jgi:hypothetical protein